MGANLNAGSWCTVRLKVQGKWGDASHTDNQDRQSHTNLMPNGKLAQAKVGDLILNGDNRLLAIMSSKLSWSIYGSSLLANFASKSGKKLPFKIEKWNNFGTNKDSLIKAISKKVKDCHWKIQPYQKNQVVVVDVDNEIRANLPSFSFAPTNLSEMIAIGGIQEVNITSEEPPRAFGDDYWDKRKYFAEPHYFRLKLKFIFKDWFGVDEGDFSSLSKPTAWLDSDGLTAFWILQHQRGYQPFITEWTYEEVVDIPL